MLSKTELRKQCKQLLNKKPLQTREYEEEKIYERLTNSVEWQSSKTVGLTIPMNHEIDTKPIIEKGLSENKRIVVPKCHIHDRTMNFYTFTSYSALKRSSFGILEPDEEKAEMAHQNDINLLVVPGLVFSVTGYRVGHGAGFYDRYLCTFMNQTISILFEEQLYEEIPVGEHDVPVQKLITPKRELIV
ncbi:5-formyltetrahydrofolate cyclo-ligase [Texcoconibacillus texcoconensis]|uniref:5-formyltetrahydrofolate cyclo-ligase n=1 Tax=Texcoconibacillus texcoconensis TaxID=1095777 RepID=A0A840QP20_9BACI|nr:5-formyltetrahydrofolate cyclo-ligase [Texcoconibacillus texcoconensis]MBB5173132.1 5-formyltetrahydrofolate cyclo-ligase [Texcoconibacillus texcoconensis]